MASSGAGAARAVPRHEVQPQRRPPVRAVPPNKKRQGRVVALRMQTVCSFAIVVVLIGWIVLNQVWLTEVAGDINAINTQIQELESENARMLSELESTISLRAIGEQAKSDLGMNRMSTHQIIHISLEQEDKIELTGGGPTPSFSQRVRLALTDFISSIQEYLGGEQNIIE